MGIFFAKRRQEASAKHQRGLREKHLTRAKGNTVLAAFAKAVGCRAPM
jgi:hypothetical protein